MFLNRHIPQRCAAFYVAVIATLFLIAPEVHAYYTNMPASVVIGQNNFESNLPNQGGSTNANTFNGARSVLLSGNKMLIADQGNNRILVFNSVPTSNNASADIVIGQPDFSSSAANQGGTADANTLRTPVGIYLDGKKLFIADYNNRRVLIFNSIPTSNNDSADVVIGQSDFTSTVGGSGANRFSNPSGVYSDGQRLFITDSNNNRVLIYNSIPAQNNASADFVLGQQDFTHVSVNQGGSVAPNTLNKPEKIFFDGKRLFISDRYNNRILIYNSIPASNNVSADVVIGQPNLTSNGANQGSTVASNTLKIPTDMYSDGTRLWVDDTGNHRVLIFNSIPTENNASADIVLGQSSFVSGSANNGVLSAASLQDPAHIATNGKQLFVADYSNSRVLIFSNELPNISLSRTITGQPNGKLRFSGTASTNITNQIIKRIEYSVNGSTWTGGFPVDGQFDSASEQYFFDFDPYVNRMADDQGYTVKIRATHDNDKDTGTSTLYFEPFFANSPLNNTFTLNRLPSFTFTIHKFRFSDLKENLDHFRVMVKREGEDWQPYIDFIPVDYNAVRQHPDNLNPNPVDTMNGTYEDKFKIVTYDQDNSVITVSPKAVDSQGNASDKYWENGGTLLSNATYQWKIQAEDHAGQFQETDPRTLRIGTRQVVTSRPYFLLSIYAISGIPGYFDISTNHPDDAPKTLTMTTDNPKFAPTFAGHAFAGSTVTFAITDTILATSSACLAATPDPHCAQSYQTTVKPDSSFRYTVPKAFRPGNSYDITVSVKDTGDNYNELPPFTVQVGAM